MQCICFRLIIISGVNDMLFYRLNVLCISDPNYSKMSFILIFVLDQIICRRSLNNTISGLMTTLYREGKLYRPLSMNAKEYQNIMVYI